jgi:YfiH family protein
MINEKYQFHSLLSYRGIVHGISSESFMSMKRLDDNEVDKKALFNFEKTLDILDPIVTMKQIHGGVVAKIDNLKTTRIADTDGMITDRYYVPLAVLTADCLPLLFYDPKKEVIAVAHAGYKGLLNDIIKNIIRRFVSDFNSNPEDIIVGIGPGIERDCYEVGKERIGEFQKAFPQFKNIFVEHEGKFYLDLRRIAQQCLVKEDILEEHIEIMNICTKCDPNFYSYRRGDKEKRFASVISLIVE